MPRTPSAFDSGHHLFHPYSALAENKNSSDESEYDDRVIPVDEDENVKYEYRSLSLFPNRNIAADPNADFVDPLVRVRRPNNHESDIFFRAGDDEKEPIQSKPIVDEQQRRPFVRNNDNDRNYNRDRFVPEFHRDNVKRWKTDTEAHHQFRTIQLEILGQFASGKETADLSHPSKYSFAGKKLAKDWFLKHKFWVDHHRDNPNTSESDRKWIVSLFPPPRPRAREQGRN